ncbi:MAG: leucine-rich repeat protein [Oscillospiraceae bacterium]
MLGFNAIAFATEDAFIEGIYAFTVENLEATVVDVNITEEEILVPKMLGGFPVSNIGSGAFGGSETIKSVILPHGIKELSPMSFAYSSGLKSVFLPETLNTIGDHAFYYCSNLNTITVPNSVKSIGNMAFGRCDGLLSATIPSTVTTIEDDAFYSSPNVTVYGKSGSVAHNYAIANKLKFADLITVTLNDTPIFFDQPPIMDMVNYRTLVPMRAILEALGATVSWDSSTMTSIATKDDITLKIKNNSNTLYINDAPKTIDAVAQIVNDRTLVPARAIIEAFGFTVTWDEPNKVLSIN